MNNIRLAKELVKVARSLCGARVDYSDDIKELENAAKNKLKLNKNVKQVEAEFTVSYNNSTGTIECDIKNGKFVYNAKSPEDSKTFTNMKDAAQWLCSEVLNYHTIVFMKGKVDEFKSTVKNAISGVFIDRSDAWFENKGKPSIYYRVWIGKDYNSLECEVSLEFDDGKWCVYSDSEIHGANYSDKTFNDYSSAMRYVAEIATGWKDKFLSNN